MYELHLTKEEAVQWYMKQNGNAWEGVDCTNP